MTLAGYYTTARPDMVAFLPAKPERVLEVGCSAGGFASAIKATGVEVWGVEPFREAAAVAATKLDRVLVGTYDEVADELPDGYFDAVVCNDVIEHMPDHDKFLREIKRKLKPDGVLIGSLPNVRFVTALIKLLAMRDWPYSDEGILDRTHLRFFTHKSIANSLRDNGYAVEELKGLSSAVRNGFLGMGRLPDLALRAATAAAVVGTFGLYRDIQYAQYGFRARPI